jgi:serine/threonine protein kinase
MSKNMEKQTFTKTFCGTNLYMSPEVSKYQEYNHKTDVWSIGVIIFFILTKKTFEFKSEINMKYILELLQNKYTYSNEYIEMLNKCFVKDPKSRIDVSELLFDFIKLLKKLKNKEEIKDN